MLLYFLLGNTGKQIIIYFLLFCNSGAQLLLHSTCCTVHEIINLIKYNKLYRSTKKKELLESTSMFIKV